MKSLNRFSTWSVTLFSIAWFFPDVAMAQSPPRDLRDWELICFCSCKGSSPDEIVKDKNNGQILFSALNGTTRERLKADGIPFTEAQINLMHDYRLLSDSAGQLRTQIPVLGPERTTRLRARMHRLAAESGKALQVSFGDLTQAVADRGYGRSTYSIVFSYVLDNLVWDELGRRQHLQDLPEKPLWNGALWAIYPRRDGPGTNSRSHGGWTLMFTWTQPVLALLHPLNLSALTYPLLDDLGNRGRSFDPSTNRELAALGILTPKGGPAVPIIQMDPSDQIHAKSLAISRKLVDSILPGIASPEISSQTRANDKRVAIVIAYHEFMWELLAYLERTGIVRPPAILSAQRIIDPKEIRSLVFFVVPRRK